MNDIAVSVKIRRKRTVSILLALALLLSLAAGCAGEMKDGASGEPMTLPEHFHVSFDGTQLSVPKTAPVITARRIIPDEEKVHSALMQCDNTRAVEAVGPIYRSTDPDTMEILDFNSYDYMTTGKLSGAVNYRRYPAKVLSEGIQRFPESILSWLSPNVEPGRRLKFDKFTGRDEFETFPVTEARKYAETAFENIGVDMTDIVNTRTAQMSKDEQIETASHMTEGDMLYMSPYTEEEKTFLSSAYVFEFRQFFHDIPVNTSDWHTSVEPDVQVFFNLPAQSQELAAAVYEDGSFSLRVENLFEVMYESEDREIVPYEEVLSKLADLFAGSIAISDTYLLNAELCYAIFDSEEKNICTLYPFWVFYVRDDLYADQIPKNEAVATFISSEDLTTVYAFDAFSGERIISIENPAE